MSRLGESSKNLRMGRTAVNGCAEYTLNLTSRYNRVILAKLVLQPGSNQSKDDIVMSVLYRMAFGQIANVVASFRSGRSFSY